MKIVVLNGSPKGDVSVTMQYVAYLRKKFPENEYEILNIAHEIRTIEKDSKAWENIIASVRSADLVIWAFPLYYLLVCSQYKRFIELITERKAQDAFFGKYAVSLSTSIHFFDQTAHAYIHAVSDDLGMKYLGMFSADMKDLLSEKEQKRLEIFFALTFSAVREKIPVQPEYMPLVPSAFVYIPGGEKTIRAGTKKVVILTDDDGSPANLAAMTARLLKNFSGSVELINLHDMNIKGGCLGCCQCGYDNTCVYTDGYVDFFNNKLVPADIIIMAGSVRDRYLSSKWKQFFDRSFFKGHTPGLAGKQIGFVIAGPLSQIPCLKEALTAWAENGGCNALFLTDEARDSEKLDALLDAMADRLVQGSELAYIPPQTFYAVGGHKIFRDRIYAGMRVVFQADYRYYGEHGMFDFPKGDIKTRLMNALLIPLTRIPGFRKKVFGDMKHHMIEPFAPVLENA
ncbi:NAD(P)H-dependent oxidoreductase [uncultured Methanoregula sp.]|uniref:NAD(P)H-dependent oxidoreductase n=1 Tax=uncultured Methanoregula sp. TaxID=1005933 RepID=UPI002AAAA13A|nr:NAD(P)H-dependent oxidoreductase [uncultured Methanoregula sp.]